MKEKLLGMTLAELQQAATSVGLKSFVGKQLAEWMYGKRVADWDGMTNIGRSAKDALSERYDIGYLTPLGVTVSTDGTRKYLFPASPSDGSLSPDGFRSLRSLHPSQPSGWAPPSDVSEGGHTPRSQLPSDRPAVEAVMIPEEDRRTLCVSSQAGCKMGCKFCMTGRQGFHGNLDAAAILSQFIGIEEACELTNAVFMGMGEPLDNYDNVMRAIEVLTAGWGFGWSPKRITLSTIGVMPTLRKYLDESRCHLAVSLHNAFPEERFRMMPAQRAFDIREVIDLLRRYDFSGQRRVSFEYTMFDGWNDDVRHADALIRLLKGLECRVNLIRFHKIPDFPYSCAGQDAMEAFKDRLNNNGIVCTIRASRGEDILAACGMLAGKRSLQGR